MLSKYVPYVWMCRQQPLKLTLSWCCGHRWRHECRGPTVGTSFWSPHRDQTGTQQRFRLVSNVCLQSPYKVFKAALKQMWPCEGRTPRKPKYSSFSSSSTCYQSVVHKKTFTWHFILFSCSEPSNMHWIIPLAPPRCCSQHPFLQFIELSLCLPRESGDRLQSSFYWFLTCWQPAYTHLVLCVGI